MFYWKVKITVVVLTNYVTKLFEKFKEKRIVTFNQSIFLPLKAIFSIELVEYMVLKLFYN